MAQKKSSADSVLEMFNAISEDVLEYVTGRIDKRVSQRVRHLEKRIDETRPLRIEIPSLEKSGELEGVQHALFEKLLRVVAVGQPVMVVGPAGTGKSHAGEACAKALGLHFYAMSVGAQTSKSDLIGYMDANKNYVTTPFRLAYETGGVFLLDEIDAGNSNVLIQLNAALANGYMSFPDKMVRRHKDFRFIASANTFGLGANRQYVGRNQLDAATLDRFVTIEWPIDETVERNLAIGHFGPAWLQVVKMVRKYVDDNELRIVVSPRATQRGSTLLAAKMDFNDVLHMALLSQFPLEIKEKLHRESWVTWRQEIDKLGPEPEPQPEPEPDETLPDWSEVDKEPDDEPIDEVKEPSDGDDLPVPPVEFNIDADDTPHMRLLKIVATSAGWEPEHANEVLEAVARVASTDLGLTPEVVRQIAESLEPIDRIGLVHELVVNPTTPFLVDLSEAKTRDEAYTLLQGVPQEKMTLMGVLVALGYDEVNWTPSEEELSELAIKAALSIHVRGVIAEANAKK